MTGKLVASTNEYSLSPRARRQRQASLSLASSTWTIWDVGERVQLIQKAHRRGMAGTAAQ